jgi:tetratricopeptide (TPR) repeat protein
MTAPWKNLPRPEEEMTLKIPTWLTWRAAALAAGAIVVLTALGAGGWFWMGVQARRAEAAYAGALARLGPAAGPESRGGSDRAAAVRDLEAALAAHPSAAAAPLAAYELGNVRYGEREYAKARGAYELAAARASSPTVRALARAGVGYTWEAERNHAKAIEAFQAGVADAKPGEFLFDELLLDLARVQAAAGKRDDAIATYRRLLKEAPKSLRLEDAKSRLARLGASP